MVNKVILVGHLTRQPELRYTQTGKAVAGASVATNRVWKDSDGKKQEAAEFHRLVFWGGQAETVSKYAGKGQQLYIEGRLQTRSWEDKDGDKRYATEVVVEDFKFLGKKKESGEEAGSEATTQGPEEKVKDKPKEPEPDEMTDGEIASDNIPF